MYRKNLSPFWQGLEELDDSPEVIEILNREFPQDASVMNNENSRREFLKMMAASIALAGLNACHFIPAEKIIPAVTTPEGSIPGKSIFYARSINQGNYAIGILVESYMGRPIKIEGNPSHPMSLGATTAAIQAEILNLYDPDRLRGPQRNRIKSSWSLFQKEWEERALILKTTKGQGLRIILEKNSSETLNFLIQKTIQKFPLAKIIISDNDCGSQLKEATLLTFNKSLIPLYHFDKAQIVASFGHDFLSDKNAGLYYSRKFSELRKNKTPDKMNRLYVIESDYSLSGAMADHRLARNQERIYFLIRAMATILNIQDDKEAVKALTTEDLAWINALAKDLLSHKNKALIVGNEFFDPEIQSLIFQMNEKIGARGSTMHYVKAFEEVAPRNTSSLNHLSEEIDRGEISDLIIISSNPVYTSPQNLLFSKIVKKVPFTVSFTESLNETSDLCHWALPQSHIFESWSDARAIDGTLSINQPLITPLYNSKSSLEFLSILVSENKSPYELIKNYWSFDTFKWEKALATGIVSESAYKEDPAKLIFRTHKFKSNPQHTSLELHFQLDPYLADGKYANNGWLQELPKPISKTCWGNAAFISPSLATTKGITNNQIINISTTAGNLDIPAFIQPGLAENIIVVHYGYGRSKAGRIGTGVGHNAFNLLHSDLKDRVEKNVSLKVTNSYKSVPCTQLHQTLDTTEPVKTKTVNQAQKLTKHKKKEASSLYPDNPIQASKDYAWGMSVDLNLCTGCNACVIGCQAENNIPIVGEEQVKLGREMHWIRIDRYYEGKPDFAKVHFQPLACVHCEKAPCEVVCPVAATSHSDEGINQMVYNRCVGTRYCSNNCPYKVRRFNFLQYHDRKSVEFKMRANPEVSVRSRGVMEKCTYCIQRITEAKINAELEDRLVSDGEIKTACQQVCPTQAIVFGNLKDPNSEVSQRHAEIRSYELLEELGTLPRTQYLTRITNPNPEMPS